MLIILNKNSNGGNGINKWQKVKKYFEINNIAYDLVLTNTYLDACKAIDERLKSGSVNTIIAAGGDGTVNGIINYLFQNNLFNDKLQFGAIGLGSSNDFHKPFNSKNMIDGIPVILPTHSIGSFWDLGMAEFSVENSSSKRFFAINSSIGLTANGNAFFNRDTTILKLLKKIHVEVANAWTIFNVLVEFDNYQLQFSGFDLLTNSQIDANLNCCNVGVLKKTNVSGGMSYDTTVKVDDGLLDVTICEKMGRFEILKIVSNLYKGKFVGTPKTRIYQFEKFQMSGHKKFNLEFDGEVFEATNIKYKVLRKSLRVC